MAFIIDDILLLPIKGVVWISEKVKDAAEAEMTDESKVQEDLLALQMRLELNEISKEEYEEKEKDILKRLDEIRKYKEKILSRSTTRER